MAELGFDVSVFDPVLPSRRISVSQPGFDTWHDHTLILRHVRERLPAVRSGPSRSVRLSGGMGLTVESIELGVVIGSIVIEQLEVLVVDEGYHDILFGSDIFQHVFDVGSTEHGDVRVSSERKDDPRALAIELYPLDGPIELRRFTEFLDAQRRLHNIALLAQGQVSATAATIDSILYDDKEIPPHLRLNLAWIDSGSIWVTLTSGSRAALTYAGRFFQTGARAKLAQEVAAAQEADNRAQISDAVRSATIETAKAEQERLRAENIAGTYRVWREEALQQIEFMDDLLARVEDPQIRDLLRQKRDQAIRSMVSQPLMPVVRNVPHEPETRSDFLLPPPR